MLFLANAEKKVSTARLLSKSGRDSKAKKKGLDSSHLLFSMEVLTTYTADRLLIPAKAESKSLDS